MEDSTRLEKAENEVEFMPLSEAAKLTGYTPEYLNLLSRKKKLKAKKIGRNWHTKKEWVEEFLAAVGNAGEFEEKSSVTSDGFPERISARGSEHFFSSEVDPINVAVVEEVKKIKELKEFSAGNDGAMKDGVGKHFQMFGTSKQSSGHWLKIFAVMSAAMIILPLLFAGSQIVKVVLTDSRKKTELARIYSDNQNHQTEIFNENVQDGKVAGIETAQTGSGTILASANFKINSINVGGNTLVLSNESNQVLQIENIKSDSFADNKKNETSLVVAWQTNKMAISELDYSKSGGQNPEMLAENSYGFNHSAVIAGLEPGASYVFQIKSKDRWANEISSDFFGVYTASKPVSVFDLISNAVGEVFGWAIKK
ncbi:MAG: fibronectin type III domain-containing protein [Parcubacteria group bacterium]